VLMYLRAEDFKNFGSFKTKHRKQNTGV